MSAVCGYAVTGTLHSVAVPDPLGGEIDRKVLAEFDGFAEAQSHEMYLLSGY